MWIDDEILIWICDLCGMSWCECCIECGSLHRDCNDYCCKECSEQNEDYL